MKKSMNSALRKLASEEQWRMARSLMTSEKALNALVDAGLAVRRKAPDWNRNKTRVLGMNAIYRVAPAGADLVRRWNEEEAEAALRLAFSGTEYGIAFLAT